MSRVEYRAMHIRAPGETHLCTVLGDIPQLGGYVCLKEGWASIQITQITLMVPTNTWIAGFLMSQNEAEALRDELKE